MNDDHRTLTDSGGADEDTARDGAVRVDPRLARAVERIENDPSELVARVGEGVLDPLAERVERGRAGPWLRGDWLGHAVHPLLTDFPLGCWLSGSLLDLLGGRGSRRAARRLIGLGVLFSLPTATAGLVEWRKLRDPRLRRVGTVHAAGNGVVLLLSAMSWRARRRRHHLRGMALSLVAGLLAWGTGYLGGHLSFGRGVGVGWRDGTTGDPSHHRTDHEEDDDVIDLRPPHQTTDRTIDGIDAATPFGAGDTMRPDAATGDTMAAGRRHGPHGEPGHGRT